MRPFREIIKRHSLVIGILLMFLLTWPIDLANAGVLPFHVPDVVSIFVGYGFVIASLAMTWLALGKEGVVGLLRRFLIWRVKGWWYLTAFFLIPGISLIGVYLNAAIRQTPVDYSQVLAYQLFGTSSNLALLVVPFFIFDALANGEEIGWRGYVLPRLQARYSALVSSLILGVIWGIWHIPKYLPHWNTISFGWFMLDVFAKAILLTWMYNNTRGSLLLVVLFHASFNTVGVFLPISTTVSDNAMDARVIVILLEIIAAAAVVLSAGAKRLSRTEPVQVQAQI